MGLPLGSRSFTCACGDGSQVWTEDVPAEHTCEVCSRTYAWVLGANPGWQLINGQEAS